MKALLLSVLMLCVGFSTVVSQTIDTSPLLSSGPLPEDVTTSHSQKYDKALIAYQVRNTDEKGNQFLRESTYVLDQLLRSGYVIFNDPIGAYVNDVLTTVVAANPSLKDKNPRAYILKTPEVNAFALDQGIVFVSLGLLAQLENEAQLALVLSHELVHIAESHVMDSFVESLVIDESVVGSKERDSQQQLDLAETMKNQYSREQEITADEIGAEYFLNTNYDYTTIVRVFDILRYGHLPFDEVPFEIDFLQALGVSIPAEYELGEIAPITPPEEDEENSTHPALDSRIIQLRNRLQTETPGDRQTFIVSEDRFMMARQRARVALPQLFLEEQLLSEAIYTAFLLEKTYGATAYAQEMTGKALYGWARFRSNGQTFDVSSPRWQKVQGESQALFHAINKMDAEELTLLAIAYNYARFQQTPDDIELKAILLDLFADLYLKHEIESLDYFRVASASSHTESTEISTIDNEIAGTSDSKIDKIQRNQQGTESITTVWDKTIFSTVLENEAFRSLAEEGFAYGKERQAEIDFFEPEKLRERFKLYRYQRRHEKFGAALGIKTVTVINPIFIHLDKVSGGDYAVDFEKSQQQLELMNEVLASCASKLDMNIRTLNPHEFQADDAARLNDLAQVKAWMSTQMDAEKFIYQAYNRTAMEDFAERYNSQFIVSVIAISIPKWGPLAKMFSKGESLLMLAVFDTRTGRRSFIKSDFIQFYLSRAFLQSELYDALNQISKTN